MVPFLTLLIAIGAGIMAIFAWELYRDYQEERRESSTDTRASEAEVIAGDEGKAVLSDQPLKVVTTAGTQITEPGGARKEIEEIENKEVPSLLEMLPYDSFHQSEFSAEGGKWNFRFKLNSPRAKFSVGGSGSSPTEAFLAGQLILKRQIREWHDARAKNILYDAATKILRAPVVMIIDDDVDVALSVEMVFKKLGCQTSVITTPDDLHRRISMSNADFIVLDWMLDEKLRASHIVEKAIRVIDSFSDLQEKFARAKPKIITYSVLEKSAITMPENSYFTHVDHWQKPISQYELAARSSELLTATGY